MIDRVAPGFSSKLKQAIWLYIDEYDCHGMLVGLGSWRAAHTVAVNCVWASLYHLTTAMAVQQPCVKVQHQLNAQLGCEEARLGCNV